MTKSNPTILETLDDPELVRQLTTRREMLGRAGKLAGVLAVASVPTALAVVTRSAFGQSPPVTVTDVLNFALTLEYLEDEFYRAGLGTEGLIPAEDRAIFTQISKHETAHVTLLEGALGAHAVDKPTFDFTAGGAFADVFSNYATFQALSQGFEDTGVRAYKGQAGNLISDPATLTIALQIHSVEARHASEVRRLRGQKGWITGNTTDVAALAAVYAGENADNGRGTSAAATEAFDEPLSKDAVLAIAGQFIVPPAMSRRK